MKKILLVIMLCAVLLVACSSEPPKNVIVDDEPSPSPSPSENPSPTPTAVKEFDITAKKWEFSPSTITVDEGDTVVLHITSMDVKHGFSLSAFNVNENLEPGTTTDVRFVADQKGTFSFVCSVFCGSGHSDMKGTLIVR